jgi:hypothetical protein
MKIKRKSVAEKHAQAIEALYGNTRTAATTE